MDDLLEIMRAYANLGSSITEQLDAVIEGESFDEQNPNALKYIRAEVLIPLQDYAIQNGLGFLEDDLTDLLERFDSYLGG